MRACRGRGLTFDDPDPDPRDELPRRAGPLRRAARRTGRARRVRPHPRNLGGARRRRGGRGASAAGPGGRPRLRHGGASARHKLPLQLGRHRPRRRHRSLCDPARGGAFRVGPAGAASPCRFRPRARARTPETAPPPSGPRCCRSIEREADEAAASLLGILWEAALGQPALASFLDQNWLEGLDRSAAPHFTAVLRRLSDQGFVIPAQAGSVFRRPGLWQAWVPACAGMTK